MNFLARFQERLTRLRERWRTSAAGRAGVIGAGFVLLLFLLEVLAAQASDYAVGRAARAVRDALAAIARQPMGLGLLGLFSCTAVVVAWCAWDSRLRPGAPAPPPPLILSPEEKDAIARIRTLWYNEGGREATHRLQGLAQEAFELARGRFYAPLLDLYRNDLGSAGAELDVQLEPTEVVPLARITEAFNALFGHYLRVAELLYGAHRERAINLAADPFLEYYRRFRAVHLIFRENLVRATNYPGVHRQLKVFAVPGLSLPSRKFLGEEKWDGEDPLDPPSPPALPAPPAPNPPAAE